MQLLLCWENLKKIPAIVFVTLHGFGRLLAASLEGIMYFRQTSELKSFLFSVEDE